MQLETVCHECFQFPVLCTPPVPQITILVPSAAEHSPWAHTEAGWCPAQPTAAQNLQRANPDWEQSSWPVTCHFCCAIFAVPLLLCMCSALSVHSHNCTVGCLHKQPPVCQPHSFNLPLPLQTTVFPSAVQN